MYDYSGIKFILYTSLVWSNRLLLSLNAETESNVESEMDVAPTTKVIQFLVRDQVGALANALQIFSVSFQLTVGSS